MKIKPEEMLKINTKPPKAHWMDVPPDFSEGKYLYPAKPKTLEYLHLPNPRDWSPADEDWKLPENWQQIIHEGFKIGRASCRERV